MRVNKNNVKYRERYAWYKSTVKNHVDYRTYIKVLNMWGMAAKALILEGKDLPLYHGFLLFGIRKKYSPTYIDYVESKKQGKKVIGSNSHSDYYAGRFYWKKKGCRFKSTNWYFRASRMISRELAAIMKTPGGHKKYVVRMVISGTAAKKQRKRFNL